MDNKGNEFQFVSQEHYEKLPLYHETDKQVDMTQGRCTKSQAPVKLSSGSGNRNYGNLYEKGEARTNVPGV